MIHDRWLWSAIAIGSITTALAWLGGPQPAALDATSTGDLALAESVRGVIDDPTGYRGLAVALVDGGTVRFAGLGDTGAGGGTSGVDHTTAFEIGSVPKVLTGMLLADLVHDGTVDADEPLGALLPGVEFESSRTAEITLAELASHRAGMPRIRTVGVTQLVGMSLRTLRGGDPYAGQDTAWLRSSLPGTKTDPGDRRVRYSNYGMAVLGHVLAERAGVPYPELLRRRILDPLEMHRTGFHLDGAALPEQRAHGTTAGGGPADPWQGSGYAPAGIGAWSTTGDLAKLVSAMLAGTATGADAATPRFADTDGSSVGYGWFTDRIDGHEVTWHNGGTGGYRAFVGFDPSAGRGVVVLGNTDRSVDDLGFALLTREDRDTGNGLDLLALGITLLLSVIGGLSLLLSAAMAKTDRLGLGSSGIWALVYLVLAYRLGGWHVVPSLVWAVGVGIGVAAVVLAVRHWRGAPLARGRHPWLRWVGTVISALAAAAVLAWLYA